MIGLELGAGGVPSPTILSEQLFLVELDFINQTYRRGAHRTRAFTDLPGAYFTRSSTSDTIDSSGRTHSFPPNTPRITDLGLFIGPGEICWLDLETPLDQLSLEIVFDPSSFYTGSGYRRVLQVVSTSHSDATAALYSDNNQDNAVRYRVEQEGAFVMGPDSLTLNGPVARVNLLLSQERCEVRSGNLIATGPGLMDLHADRIILGSEGTHSTIGLPSLMGVIHQLRIKSS